MSVIDRALKALPSGGLRVERSDHRLTVPAVGEQGFTVVLAVHTGREYEVHGEGWVERFSRAEDAYDCFVLLLSEEARLKITLRGAMPVAWQLERREYGLWMPKRPVRRRLVPFWRPARTAWKHNHVFKAESS